MEAEAEREKRLRAEETACPENSRMGVRFGFCFHLLVLRLTKLAWESPRGTAG